MTAAAGGEPSSQQTGAQLDMSATSSMSSETQLPSTSMESSTTAPADAAAAASPAAADQQQPPAKKKPKQWDPLSIPGPMEIMQQDVMNNCFVKSALSGVMGGVAGFAFGLFSASIENAAPMEMPGASGEVRDKPTRVVLKEMYTNMKTKSLSFAKGFAYFGALYSFNECVVEKYRAKHDRLNPALAGCATGAMMAYGGGPQAMCLGCVSVGAFSVAIEHFFDM